MKQPSKIITLSMLILSAATSTACKSSGSAKPEETAGSVEGAKYCASCTVAPTPPTASPTPVPTSPPGDDSNESNNPLIETTVRGIGYTSTTFTVPARKVLKLRFRPGMQDRTVAGTGFVANYSKLGVYIKVGTLEQPTPMLSNGFSYESSRESGTLDFSSQIPQTCAASNPACRVNMVITVQRPNYDYWCINYGMYCPWARVHENHPWNGSLRIQTDDTEALQ